MGLIKSTTSKRMCLFFSRPWNANIVLREHEHFKTVNILYYNKNYFTEGSIGK